MQHFLWRYRPTRQYGMPTHFLYKKHRIDLLVWLYDYGVLNLIAFLYAVKRMHDSIICIWLKSAFRE